MDSKTSDRVYILQKIAELEHSLSNLKLDENSNNELLKSIGEIKFRFSAQSDNDDIIQNEKKMERRLSQINDKDMEALMNDILPNVQV